MSTSPWSKGSRICGCPGNRDSRLCPSRLQRPRVRRLPRHRASSQRGRRARRPCSKDACAVEARRHRRLSPFTGAEDKRRSGRKRSGRQRRRRKARRTTRRPCQPPRLAHAAVRLPRRRSAPGIGALALCPRLQRSSRKQVRHNLSCVHCAPCRRFVAMSAHPSRQRTPLVRDASRRDRRLTHRSERHRAAQVLRERGGFVSARRQLQRRREARLRLRVLLRRRQRRMHRSCRSRQPIPACRKCLRSRAPLRRIVALVRPRGHRGCCGNCCSCGRRCRLLRHAQPGRKAARHRHCRQHDCPEEERRVGGCSRQAAENGREREGHDGAARGWPCGGEQRACGGP